MKKMKIIMGRYGEALVAIYRSGECIVGPLDVEDTEEYAYWKGKVESIEECLKRLCEKENEWIEGDMQNGDEVEWPIEYDIIEVED